MLEILLAIFGVFLAISTINKGIQSDESKIKKITSAPLTITWEIIKLILSGRWKQMKENATKSTELA
jgi:hypothetical protein